MARIGGAEAHVTVIDGHPVSDLYIEILPGEHEIEVAMAAPLAGFGVMRSTHDLIVCFGAYPGRFYVVKPAASIPYVHNHWRPAVFDQQADVFVEHPCPAKSTVGVVRPGASPTGDQSSAIVNTTADLRSAPSSAAPVLIHLNAGAEIIVSRQVQDGWRLTSLRDGRVAYVRDVGLHIAAPAPYNAR